MRISLRILESFGLDLQEYKTSPQKLATLLTDAGLEVEEIIDQGALYSHVVIGEILERNKHPNADQLTLCLVNTGDKNRRIVCGAKNHKAGDKVVVALPGAVLPGNFAIKVSKIRGEESEGMLCSEKELGLKAESEGILILPTDAPLGDSFAKYFKKDDILLELKVTPNRADCLSHFGLAREISALTGKSYKANIGPVNEGRESTKKLIKVNVEDSERAIRYSGRLVKNIKVQASPLWLKEQLESLGLRSINNVVDITNYILMVYGQPLHAFDFTKLKGAAIIVRAARSGEKLLTLDGRDLELKGQELVIADAQNPVALAGIMGGLESGVTETSTDVFIEAAVFNAATVRRTSKLHGISSDSSYRFARGVDPEGVISALSKCCQMLEELCGGSICSDFYDIYPRPASRVRIEMDLKFISSRLGINIEATEAKRILERLGCVVSGGGDKLLVNPPTYRVDLRLAEDLGEEILRFKGFSSIPETIPVTQSAPTSHNKEFILEQKLAEFFSGLGMSQAVNWSLQSPEFETQVLGNPQGSEWGPGPIKIQNPLNLDLASLRRMIFPSLLKNVSHNYSHGVKSGTLFEVAPVFYKREKQDIQNQIRPFDEESHLALCLWGVPRSTWQHTEKRQPYFRLKAYLEAFVESWAYKSAQYLPFKTTPEFLHPGQSAQVQIEGKIVGFLGVVHPILSEKLKVDAPVVIAELNLAPLLTSQPKSIKSKDAPKYPAVERDVALIVPNSVFASQVKSELVKAGGALLESCDLFDLYEGKNLPADTRSMAYRLTYRDPDKTWVEEEVNALHQKVVEQICKKLGLSVR